MGYLTWCHEVDDIKCFEQEVQWRSHFFSFLFCQVMIYDLQISSRHSHPSKSTTLVTLHQDECYVGPCLHFGIHMIDLSANS